MRWGRAALCLLGLTIMAGCGGDGDGDSTDKARSVTEGNERSAQGKVSRTAVHAALARELGARSNGVYRNYKAPGATGRCSILAVMASPKEVATWRGVTSDPEQSIVTDPTGNAGVKVTSEPKDKAACLSAAKEALSGL